MGAVNTSLPFPRAGLLDGHLRHRPAGHPASVLPGGLDEEPPDQRDTVPLDVAMVLGLAGLVRRGRESHVQLALSTLANLSIGQRNDARASEMHLPIPGIGLSNWASGNPFHATWIS